MSHHRSEWRGRLKVALIAALAAVAGQAVILFDDFGAGNKLDSDSARMVTAAAVSKAGAIETWPERGQHLARVLIGSSADGR